MTTTRKIGLNRGKRRIWLEGKVLTDNGIKHGMRFDIEHAHNRLTIMAGKNGQRKIAGTTDRPIIDMSGATITQSFADDVRTVDH